MPILRKLLSRKTLRRGTFGVAALAAVGALSALALDQLDRAFPPPLDTHSALSKEVVDRDGALLRAYAAGDGTWRLATGLDSVDPEFVKMLVAYEDKRFWDHEGVDPLALMRAAGQFAANGRIVSGGSTL